MVALEFTLRPELQARLVLSEARREAAEAGERLQECLFMREELAHTLTRCKLTAVCRNVCIGVRARVLGCTVDSDSDLGRSGHV